jgi:hypothetical protein
MVRTWVAMRRARAAALLTAAALWCAAGPVAAADPHAKPEVKPDAAAVAAAKSHFTAGLKLYKEGSVREALAEFQVAYRTVPRASVLRNIAQCHRDLRDFAAAHARYAELLSTYGASMKKNEAADVKRAIGELAALTGTITVKSTEPGATALLDDKELGKTPLAEPVRVNLGPHKVTVQKPGFDPFTRQLEVQGGESVVVDAALVKEVTTGHLAVTVPDADPTVRVRVDGAEVGAPPWEGDLAPGPHEVAAEGEAARAPAQRVELARAARLDVALTLRPRAGHVTIDPRQPGARIAIDGAPVGTGIWEGDLKIGRHDVVIEADGFAKYQHALIVHDDEKIVERAALDPLPPAPKEEWAGVYGGLNLAFQASPRPSDTYSSLCRADATGCQQSSPALGGDLFVNVGYSFGWVGLEAVGLFRADHTDARYLVPTNAGRGWSGPARVEHLALTRLVAAGGLGVRGFTKGTIARGTIGTAFLVGRDTALGTLSVTDSTSATCPPGQVCDTSADVRGVKTVPALHLDAALLLGSTPGVKLRLGIAAMFEMVGDLYSDAGATFARQVCSGGTCSRSDIVVPPVRFSQGTQFFVGPTIGMQFGY